MLRRRRDVRVDARARRGHAAHARVGVRAPLGIGVGREAAPEELDGLVGGRARGLDLEEHLQRRLAARVARAHCSLPLRLRTRRRRGRAASETISIALTAASHPLLPALVPARSIACSIVSVVSTPKATGTSLSAATGADALGGLARDVVEVRGRAADDGAERDDRVDLLRGGDAPTTRGISQAPGTRTT